ncbi:uncharacterized protein LOC111638920 [Centruroides sculpturatus]|uniref:uncharacterized protein LOC111638918 n=1 Tax=Centruroides sculpturatus TaxID=218467 RepID=UPI000C6D20DF|nr:uncharacterized protein LOC111638918 [Centruroides sculpturatus]XP_023240461.1 uncharacterized protein LOC111638920 [Centruroides sculpturatus]
MAVFNCVDCLHLQLYRDSKDKCKNGPTKASLSLEGFLGMETGFTLDKESNTMALICSEVVVILAFDSRELLIQWQVKIRSNLVEDQQFLVQVSHVPVKSKIACGPARLHLQDYAFCLTSNVPPRLLGTWPIKELRRFGVVDGKFCFEGGSRCGKGEGVHVLLTNQAEELAQAFELASKGKLLRKRKLPLRKHSVMESSTCGSSHPKYYKNTESSTNRVQNKDNCDACSVHLSSEKKEDTYMPRAPCSEHYRWMGSESQSGENDEVSLTLHNFHLPTQRYSIFGSRSLCHCSKCGRQYYRRDGMPISERATDNEGFTPKWTMDLAVLTQSQHPRNPPKDRSSMCSQSSATSSSSSGTASSDYSVPRSSADGFYDRPRTMHHSGTTPPKSPTKVHQSAGECVCQRCSGERLPVICSCWSTLPVSVLRVSENVTDAKGQSRSPSPKKPTHKEDLPSCTCRINPYLHYAVPKNVLCRTNWRDNFSELSDANQSRRISTAGEDYDIPKKLKENKLEGRTESEDNAHTCDCHKIMLWKKNSSESGSFVAVPLLLDRSLPCVTESTNKQRSNIKNTCHACTNVRKEDEGRTSNPDYANMRFIEALRLYENVCCIVTPSKNDNQKEPNKLISKTLPLYKDSRGNWHCPGCRIARSKGETKRNVANIYEIMSYSSSEKDDDNYLEMQPVYWESSSKTEISKEESKSDSEANVDAKNNTESLPLRPFMPFLLPCQKKKSGEESETEDIEITEEIQGRSVRSNSLGDLKKKVLLKSKDSNEKTEGSSSVDESNFQIMGSPKLTPVKKHTLLSKLTLRSKEKSFSTDEISPPSSVPSTPNNMFLETLHKYPFHKSADCVQLKENFSVSEEDLTIDHDNYHSRDTDGRAVIKRSSSAPCKPNTKIKSNSCDSGISTTLSRRVEVTGDDNKYSNDESNVVSTDLKLSSGNADQIQQSCCHVQAKGLEGTSKALLVTECRRCHHFLTSPEHFLLLDTGATASSSSSSDISDYIETLSLCSRSSSSSGSSDYMRAADVFGTKGPVFCTSALRPRSGKEYHMVDRLTLHDTGQFVFATHDKTCPNCEAQEVVDVKEGTSCKTNSPSPGYVSSSPGNLECVCSPSSQHHFVFPKDDKELNYLQVNVEDQETSGEIPKYGMVQYAVIDVLATTAAQKLCSERAHERQEATDEESNP